MQQTLLRHVRSTFEKRHGRFLATPCVQVPGWRPGQCYERLVVITYVWTSLGVLVLCVCDVMKYSSKHVYVGNSHKKNRRDPKLPGMYYITLCTQ